MSDPVFEFLNNKGCGDHIIKGGLAGLVETWEGVVEAVADEYQLGMDDYLNDLDSRQLLEDALAVAPKPEQAKYDLRVSEADEQMKSLTTKIEECLWSDEVAEEEGWNAKANWWYYRIPKSAGEDLMDELNIEID